jgi:hypothetical protein
LKIQAIVYMFCVSNDWLCIIILYCVNNAVRGNSAYLTSLLFIYLDCKSSLQCLKYFLCSFRVVLLKSFFKNILTISTILQASCLKSFRNKLIFYTIYKKNSVYAYLKPITCTSEKYPRETVIWRVNSMIKACYKCIVRYRI